MAGSHDVIVLGSAEEIALRKFMRRSQDHRSGELSSFEQDLHRHVQAFERSLLAAALARYDTDAPYIEVSGQVYRRGRTVIVAGIWKVMEQWEAPTVPHAFRLRLFKNVMHRSNEYLETLRPSLESWNWALRKPTSKLKPQPSSTAGGTLSTLTFYFSRLTPLL